MSNARKARPRCDEPGCRRTADVEATAFDNLGTVHTRRWLCRTHAVDVARHFGGRLWADPQCTCGCVDGIINDAGRS